MACTLHNPLLAAAQPPAMTRCECAGLAFTEVAREVAAAGLAEPALRRLGCAQTCGACLPDLMQFLEGAAAPAAREL